MQGFVVVPLFAGYDERRGRGRVFSYDATGGKYEEADFQTNGSGGVHARNWIKATWREDISRDEAIDLALRALFAAADEDTATGGPDIVRGIFPTVATIFGGGLRSHSRRHRTRHRPWPRRSSAAAKKERACERPVLRAAGADDQGQGRLHAEEHRQGSRPHRITRPRASSSSPRTSSARSTRSARSTTASRSAGSGSTTSSRTSACSACARPTSRATILRVKTSVHRARQHVRPDARAAHPRDEALRGGDPARRGRHHGRGQAVPHHLRRHGHGRRGLHRARRPRRDHRRRARHPLPTGRGHDAAIRLCVDLLGGPDNTLGPDSLEVAILDHATTTAFRCIEGPELSTILAG